MRDPCDTCPDFDSAWCVDCKFFDDSRLFPPSLDSEEESLLQGFFASVLRIYSNPERVAARKAASLDDLPF